MRALHDVEIFRLEEETAHCSERTRHISQLVTHRRDGCRAVWIYKRSFAEYRCSNRIPVAVEVRLAIDLRAPDIVIADCAVEPGNPGRATKRFRLPAVIGLNAADRPASQDNIGKATLI